MHSCVQRDGHTCVMLALGGQLAAVVSLFDAVKPEARGVVTALGRSGLECHLLTGTHCLLQAAHDSTCFLAPKAPCLLRAVLLPRLLAMSATSSIAQVKTACLVPQETTGGQHRQLEIASPSSTLLQSACPKARHARYRCWAFCHSPGHIMMRPVHDPALYE